MKIILNISDGKTNDRIFDLSIRAGIKLFVDALYDATNCGYAYHMYIDEREQIFSSLNIKP